MYARNKQGPKTEPWGTPDRTGTADYLPSTTTDWFWFRRKTFVQETVFRLTPELKSL